ncbi:hypothetical protein HMPREF9151_01694 [Hoylesella saccharolytica F0055]|uniref:Uncharacterized protein n=1 Tax=Hoylesella saccharolytica F0055 TaxID=1127699 RepID=L1N7Y6_9BACT|nr:hypothetical protein HMPREF9151_01694 [Hoylesella saccharolytica F0055]
MKGCRRLHLFTFPLFFLPFSLFTLSLFWGALHNKTKVDALFFVRPPFIIR